MVDPAPNDPPHPQPPPQWAVDEATDELYDAENPQAIVNRASELARERQDQRHDEYDDADQGGEA